MPRVWFVWHALSVPVACCGEELKEILETLSNDPAARPCHGEQIPGVCHLLLTRIALRVGSFGWCLCGFWHCVDFLHFLARKAAYSRMGRALKKSSVPVEVLNRYKVDQKCEKKKFTFLMEFLLAFRGRRVTHKDLWCWGVL